MNSPKLPRLNSIDAVRGLIMVVMALDHARDFLGLKAFNVTDLTKTDAPYFFTRWVTHFCAPGFMFLAGTAAFLARRPRPELSRFLLTRGLWLVFAELTLINFAWSFSFRPPLLMVIWALGWSMVLLAALVWLPAKWLAVLSLITIGVHNAFDGLHAGPLADATGTLVGTGSDWALSLLHQKNAPVIYPLIPWVAVMALGFSMGPLFLLEAQRRTRVLVIVGVSCIAAFFVLRGLNLYGDLVPWTPQASSTFTVLSFLNVTKYPPSLMYLLMTLGPLFLLLALAERMSGPAIRLLVVFGRVPFFYYLLHLVLLHAMAVGLGLAQGFSAAEFMSPFWKFPKAFGLNLGGVYVVWAAAVLLLYLPSRWFAALKARRKDWWLSYL
ncbi:MAG: heparan-alpha-glucosaminide N-acetyltransferase domain-containing protein [Archangium sp.]|nr:heparan-alpha-glucosaminide N-acetyltransferase domain-containing protein [Archangium sp.]MDP3572949.1 heparan-alpha-glucosaminide N-acetyltransferase domain-containing protein [Archangium sp.]